MNFLCNFVKNNISYQAKYIGYKDEKVDTREETVDGNTATVHTLKGELKIGNDDLINKENEYFKFNKSRS